VMTTSTAKADKPEIPLSNRPFSIDAAALFIEAMSAVTQPVSVVTAAAPDRPFGLTVGSFVSVSVRPKLISVALNNQSLTLTAAIETGRLGVNILGLDGTATAARFARTGVDRFASVPWRWDQGLPRLELAQIWIPCSLRSAIAAGDHTILLAEVDDVTRVPGPTLAYRDRGYVAAQALPEPEEL
jgi:flavin reductase (DIM6/NTAB) family NADH-FMN oxidoreductase RutF